MSWTQKYWNLDYNVSFQYFHAAGHFSGVFINLIIIAFQYAQTKAIQIKWLQSRNSNW